MANIVHLDDHLELITRMAEILRSAGHHVTPAQTESDALAALERGGVDLLIQDLMRPGLGGAGFLRMLRSDPRYERLPVMIFTATYLPGVPAFLPDPEGGEPIPIQSWVTKPAPVEELLDEIVKVLERVERAR